MPGSHLLDLFTRTSLDHPRIPGQEELLQISNASLLAGKRDLTVDLILIHWTVDCEEDADRPGKVWFICHVGENERERRVFLVMNKEVIHRE